jgi:hypothetical protein
VDKGHFTNIVFTSVLRNIRSGGGMVGSSSRLMFGRKSLHDRSTENEKKIQDITIMKSEGEMEIFNK